MEDLARSVLVTGAARGFGRACVEVFSAAGWNVIAAARALPSNAAADPRVAWVRWNVTDDDTESLVDAVAGRPLDLLVDNAGCGTPGTARRSVQLFHEAAFQPRRRRVTLGLLRANPSGSLVDSDGSLIVVDHP